MKRAYLLAWLAVGAVAIGSGAYLLFESVVPAEGPGEERVLRLIPFAVDEISAVDIVLDGAAHRFARDAEGNWFYHSHAQQEAAAEGHSHVVDLKDSEHIAAVLNDLAATGVAETTDAGEAAAGEPEMLVFFYQPGDPRPAWRLRIHERKPGSAGRTVTVSDVGTTALIPETPVTGLITLIDRVTAAPAEPDGAT